MEFRALDDKVSKTLFLSRNLLSRRVNPRLKFDFGCLFEEEKQFRGKKRYPNKPWQLQESAPGPVSRKKNRSLIYLISWLQWSYKFFALLKANGSNELIALYSTALRATVRAINTTHPDNLIRGIKACEAGRQDARTTPGKCRERRRDRVIRPGKTVSRTFTDPARTRVSYVPSLWQFQQIPLRKFQQWGNTKPMKFWFIDLPAPDDCGTWKKNRGKISPNDLSLLRHAIVKQSDPRSEERCKIEANRECDIGNRFQKKENHAAHMHMHDRPKHRLTVCKRRMVVRCRIFIFHLYQLVARSGFLPVSFDGQEKPQPPCYQHHQALTGMWTFSLFFSLYHSLSLAHRNPSMHSIFLILRVQIHRLCRCGSVQRYRRMTSRKGTMFTSSVTSKRILRGENYTGYTT